MSWLRIIECCTCHQPVLIGEDDLIYRTIRNHSLQHEIARMVLFRCYECKNLQYLPPSIMNHVDDINVDTPVDSKNDIDNEFDTSDTPVYTIEPDTRRCRKIKKENDKTKKGF